MAFKAGRIEDGSGARRHQPSRSHRHSPHANLLKPMFPVASLYSERYESIDNPEDEEVVDQGREDRERRVKPGDEHKQPGQRAAAPHERGAKTPVTTKVGHRLAILRIDDGSRSPRLAGQPKSEKTIHAQKTGEPGGPLLARGDNTEAKPMRTPQTRLTPRAPEPATPRERVPVAVAGKQKPQKPAEKPQLVNKPPVRLDTTVQPLNASVVKDTKAVPTYVAQTDKRDNQNEPSPSADRVQRRGGANESGLKG